MQEQASPLGLAVADRVVFPTPVIAVFANVQKAASELGLGQHQIGLTWVASMVGITAPLRWVR